MSISSPGGKLELAAWIRDHVKGNVLRVLDVGAGKGWMLQRMKKFGVLVDAHWIGIEAWAPFVKEFSLAKYYDEVIVCDVRFFDWAKRAPFDIVFLGDVLEHMPEDDAVDVLASAKRAARFVVAAFPVEDILSAGNENPFDNHVVNCIPLEQARALFGEPIWSWHDQTGVFVYEGEIR